ncbi:ArsR/SmtB family transcription factor [Cohnella silvisoli]|uniref:Metalloregulator ArsR/SmtB family transcription factor n=1 Tax=Cohnella silvisoli TaxID=2873699 RepID=A0ABV1KPB7_9BACL|nr:metalloregulator ArsR/SmtB family transcription factor [Cohnella silvisoli]MCD9025588.1 metalloregulator ArsR/SmtB family transcription factor [Cohnella silvisoli]
MNTTFSALAEPNRLNIVELLCGGPLPVGEISDRIGLGQPQTSRHLRILGEANLVEVQPVANRRIYKLRSEPFQDLDSWLIPFRRTWEERLDRFDEFLQKLHGEQKNKEEGRSSSNDQR